MLAKKKPTYDVNVNLQDFHLQQTPVNSTCCVTLGAEQC